MNQSFSCGPSGVGLLSVLRGRPQAVARVTGGPLCPGLSGAVQFYQTGKGVVVCAEIHGLPRGESPCHEPIFGFHIHQGTDCAGTADDPFADAKAHFDPDGCAHPYHSGDLPPLFGNDGVALCAFLTNRFSVDEVIGRTVILHGHPDDLTTQPSGNSGTKIACGVIQRVPGSCR